MSVIALPAAPEPIPVPRPPQWHKHFKLFGFVMSNDEYLDWISKNKKLDFPAGRQPTRDQLISNAQTYCSSLVLAKKLGIARLVWPADEAVRAENPHLRLIAFATGTNRSQEDLDKAYDVDRIRQLAKFLGKEEDAMPEWYTFSPR